MSTDTATINPAATNGVTTPDGARSSVLFLLTTCAMATLVFCGVFVAGESLFGLGPEGADEPEALAAVADGPAWEPAGEADIARFVADWEHSRTGRYALSGILERSSLSDDESTLGFISAAGEETEMTALPEQPLALPVRRVQLDENHSLYQVGPMATVVDPVNGRRNCQRYDGDFWCASDSGGQGQTPGPDTSIVGVEQAVSGGTASHRLYRMVDFASTDIATTPGAEQLNLLAAQLRCWDVRALTGDQGHRWGRRSQFCFDAATGAPVMNRTFGQYRTEVFIAHSLSSDAALQDLDPQP